MIGIRLPENFNRPYAARSISDFWRRWHMTLTTWFREYVFYPLERRRLRWAGQQINIIIVFLLTGLWHGFKPTYILWGLLHGIVLAIESLGFGRWLSHIWRPLQHAYTLTVILIGWVLFRSDSLIFAGAFFRRLAGDVSELAPLPFSQTSPLPFVDLSVALAIIAGVIFIFPITFLRDPRGTNTEPHETRNPIVFQALTDLLLISMFILGLAASVSQKFLPNIYATF
jgi:alginate O-acetyltransferase complex protein AlgI